MHGDNYLGRMVSVSQCALLYLPKMHGDSYSGSGLNSPILHDQAQATTLNSTQTLAADTSCTVIASAR